MGVPLAKAVQPLGSVYGKSLFSFKSNFKRKRAPTVASALTQKKKRLEK